MKINGKIVLIMGISLTCSLFVSFNANKNNNLATYAYDKSKLPTTIDVSDTSENEIREYYSSLNGKNLSKDDLLMALKPILKEGQQYFSYDDGPYIWQMYEITDRDLKLSPYTDLNGTEFGSYDEENLLIRDYKYGTSYSSSGSNPYVHMLYRDYDNPGSDGDLVNGRAWDDHNGSSTFPGMNREHVWPKSRGFDDKLTGARGDPHHLLPGDARANNRHNNLAYGYVDKSVDYETINYFTFEYSNFLGKSLTAGDKFDDNVKVFEPQDCDKGDIARACFYMVARYNNLAKDDVIDSANPNLILNDDISYSVSGSGGVESDEDTPINLGLLSDLLEWNKLDPVDDFEIHRNNLIFNNYGKNRNPFVDFPSWADIIWGDASGVANPSSDKVSLINPGQIINVTGVSLDESISLYENETYKLNYKVFPVNATNKTVTWSSLDESVATVDNGMISAIKEGETTIQVVTEDGNFTANCHLIVNKLPVIGETCYVDLKNGNFANSKITWSTDEDVSHTTITQNKGTGSAVNGDYVNLPRIYKGNYLEFLTNSSYKIKTVEITYDSTYSGNNILVGTNIENNIVINSDDFNCNWSDSSNGTHVISTKSEKGVEHFYVQNNPDASKQLHPTNIKITYSVYTKELLDIELSGDYPLTFYVGDEFDKGDMIVTANYDDLTNKVVTENVEFDVNNFEEPGEYEVNVIYSDEYGQASTSYTVNVYEIEIVDISIKQSPKTLYEYNESFDPTGLIITVYYNNESQEDIVYSPNSGITFDINRALIPSDTLINICYEGFYISLPIIVNPSKVVDHIEASSNKTTLEYGENLTIDDINVTYFYTDGHALANQKPDSISGFDSHKVGEQTITINAMNKSTSLKVVVNASTVIDHIEASSNKTILEYGENLTKDDINVTYFYTDGHTLTNQKPDSISGFDSKTSGEQTISVNAKGKTTTIKVNVKPAPSSGCNGSVVACSVLVSVLSIFGIIGLTKKKIK